jgi:hypothetical protein
MNVSVLDPTLFSDFHTSQIQNKQEMHHLKHIIYLQFLDDHNGHIFNL